MKEEVFYTKKNIKDIKIAIIADIHYCPNYNNKNLNKIANQLLSAKPQYLIVAGDILDRSNYDYQGLINFFQTINKEMTIIVVLGNHDNYIEKKDKTIIEGYNESFIQELKQLENTYVLNDEKILIDNICFYGFNLSFNHYMIDKESYSSFCEQIPKLNPSLEDKNYNITIVHSPVNIYKYIQNNPQTNLAKSNLIISGHTHNGCLHYWFTNILNKAFKTNRSLVSPYHFLFPKYAQGRVYKPIDGIIYEGVVKLSKSSGILSKFDFIFSKRIKIITIKRQ